MGEYCQEKDGRGGGNEDHSPEGSAPNKALGVVEVAIDTGVG